MSATTALFRCRAGSTATQQGNTHNRPFALQNGNTTDHEQQVILGSKQAAQQYRRATNPADHEEEVVL